MEAVERFDDVGAICFVIPEKESSLGHLFLGACGGENFLTGVGVYARVIDLGGEGHRCRGEILHLLQMHVQVAGCASKQCHVEFSASGVR